MGSEMNHEAWRDSALALVAKAFEEDVPLDRVTESVEKAILAHAIRRHSCLKNAYEALRVPRATFFLKKKRYELSSLPST